MKVLACIIQLTILNAVFRSSEKSYTMNHLESSFTGKNNFWRYAVMFVTVFLVSNSIGALPLVIVITVKSLSDPSVLSHLAAHPNDLSILGLDKNISLILMLFPFIASLVAFILLIKPLNGRRIKTIINGTSKIRWNHFFISGLVWLILSMTYLFVYLKADPSNFVINNTTVSLVILTVVSLTLIPFQAALEEVLFRGYLMQGFARWVKNRWFPLVMTSVMFGLMHSLNPEVRDYGFLTMMPQYVVFGLVFGITTILDDGIEASMGAHAANNIFLCVMVTNQSSALQTDALFTQLKMAPWIELAGLAMSGILFVFILSKIFRWGKLSLIFEKIHI
jgi:membrane protease YdiL (CAAX protease family)